MRKVKYKLCAVLLVFVLAGCGVRARRSIVEYMPQSKYRSVIVLAFKSQEPNSILGQAAADAMAASLGDLGFTVVNREFARKRAMEKGISSDPTLDDMRSLAKDLNISGIVQGVVSEAGERQEQIGGTVETYNRTYDAWGNTQGGDFRAQGPSTQTIAKFSASASLTDIQNGSVVWSGSIADSFNNSTVQYVANDVMTRLATELGNRLMKLKY